jgi:hypothetical protein
MVKKRVVGDHLASTHGYQTRDADRCARQQTQMRETARVALILCLRLCLD